jgi:hypothetical protein
VLRVYLWRDRWDGPDGWVVGDFACAAEDAAGLREACRSVGVTLPSRPQRARATDDVVQIALAHAGQVLLLPGKDPHWRVLPPAR